MPSPITHIAAGYAVYKIVHKWFPTHELGRFWKIPWLFLVAVGLAVIPDMDSVLGILLGDFGRYHNQGSHSLITGLVVALVIAGVVYWRQKESFAIWFFITLFAYESHVLLDYFTHGRGVKVFWPFSPERFSSPVLLFYGLHWSDGLISINHIWTVLTEVGLILLVYLLFQGFQKYQRKKNDHPQINDFGEEYANDRTWTD